MKMPYQSSRALIMAVVAAAVSASAALAGEMFAGAVVNGVALAAIAGACSALALMSIGCAGSAAIVRPLEKTGANIDDIMIGAAETSYFVDSIKRKVEQDIQTANEIAASSEQNAGATRQIAANAERASKIAADMRKESMAGAGAVDDNGYFPTHNKKFSRPLTGRYDTDLVNNRTKRIFNDRTGSRCGSNTKPFLLQTYKRDTGEVMHDFSAPIRVAGKHWGGFRIGYRSGTAQAGTADNAAPVPAAAVKLVLARA